MKRKRNNKTEARNTAKTLERKLMHVDRERVQSASPSSASWQSWTHGNDSKQRLCVSLVIDFVSTGIAFIVYSKKRKTMGVCHHRHSLRAHVHVYVVDKARVMAMEIV